MISFIRGYEMWRRSAASFWVMLRGLRKSSRKTSPGWVGRRYLGRRMVTFPLVVVDDLDLVGALLSPPEADPVLVVDANRMLCLSVATELLEAESRKRERSERNRRIQLVQLPTCILVEVPWERSPS